VSYKFSKVDENQPYIVERLRKIGATVLHIHTIKNAADILVGYRGRNFLFEIKATEKDNLTKGEEEFQRNWVGQVSTITCIEQAIEIMSSKGI
jgi:hypothetical protein